jgi:hypothetical protein
MHLREQSSPEGVVENDDEKQSFFSFFLAYEKRSFKSYAPKK